MSAFKYSIICVKSPNVCDAAQSPYESIQYKCVSDIPDEIADVARKAGNKASRFKHAALAAKAAARLRRTPQEYQAKTSSPLSTTAATVKRTSSISTAFPGTTRTPPAIKPRPAQARRSSGSLGKRRTSQGHATRNSIKAAAEQEQARNAEAAEKKAMATRDSISALQALQEGDADKQMTLDERKSHIYNLFEQFDADGDGELSHEEIAVSMEASEDICDLINLLMAGQGADEDGDGEISVDEFIAFVDKDGDGEITILEFMHGLGGMHTARASQLHQIAAPRQSVMDANSGVVELQNVLGHLHHQARKSMMPASGLQDTLVEEDGREDGKDAARASTQLRDLKGHLRHRQRGTTSPEEAKAMAQEYAIHRKLVAARASVHAEALALAHGAVEGMTHDEFKDSIYGMFDTLDVDGDGQLTHDEIAKGLEESSGVRNLLNQLMAGADVDGDGEVSVDEFISYVSNNPKKEGKKTTTIREEKRCF